MSVSVMRLISSVVGLSLGGFFVYAGVQKHLAPYEFAEAILVLLITMARELKIDCGCGLFTDRQVGPGAFLEDALLLGVAGWSYWRECKAGDREEGLLTPVKSK